MNNFLSDFIYLAVELCITGAISLGTIGLIQKKRGIELESSLENAVVLNLLREFCPYCGLTRLKELVSAHKEYPIHIKQKAILKWSKLYPSTFLLNISLCLRIYTTNYHQYQYQLPITTNGPCNYTNTNYQ
jgi:hypothetical protein